MTRQPKPASCLSTQSGFTIIEALLAIIIVSVLMAAIAPVIILSTATRLQARRVELATQAARAYVDGVRSGAIETPDSVVRPQPVRGGNPRPKILERVAAPISRRPNCTPPANITTNFYCDPEPSNRPNPSAVNLFCVNMDGNPRGCNRGSSKSLIIQAFRSVTSRPPGSAAIDPSDDGSKGYILGVRVYRADAFDGRTRLTTSEQTGGKKVATYAGGLGTREAPLVELTTEVRGENASDDTNYNNLCERLGGCQ